MADTQQLTNAGIETFFKYPASVPGFWNYRSSTTNFYIHWGPTAGPNNSRSNRIIDLGIRFRSEGDTSFISLRNTNEPPHSHHWSIVANGPIYVRRYHPNGQPLRLSIIGYRYQTFVGVVEFFIDCQLLDRVYIDSHPNDNLPNAADWQANYDSNFNARFGNLLANTPPCGDTPVPPNLPPQLDVPVPDTPPRRLVGVQYPIEMPAMGGNTSLASWDETRIPAFLSHRFYIDNRQFVFRANTGQITTTNRPGSMWVGEYQLPDLSPEQYNVWRNFIDSLQGQFGTFRVFDPDHTPPRGNRQVITMDDTPHPPPSLDDVLDHSTITIAVKAPIAGTDDTRFWELSPHFLLPGDYINLSRVDNNVAYLHKITATELATNNTRLVCNITPSIQSPVANADTLKLHLDNPSTAARLERSDPTFLRTNNGLWQFRFKWIESVGEYTRSD